MHGGANTEEYQFSCSSKSAPVSRARANKGVALNWNLVTRLRRCRFGYIETKASSNELRFSFIRARLNRSGQVDFQTQSSQQTFCAIQHWSKLDPSV
jgi:hypothetical protein